MATAPMGGAGRGGEEVGASTADHTGPDPLPLHTRAVSSEAERRRRYIARGKAIAASGRYVPPRGAFLGTLETWGLDVFDGSPPEWKSALLAEIRDAAC